MCDEHISTLTHMEITGKDIPAIFAGSFDQDKVMSMTQALLDIMESDSPRLHESRLMLLGALAAPLFADIGVAHAPSSTTP